MVCLFTVYCSCSLSSFASVNKQFLFVARFAIFCTGTIMPRSIRPRTIACPVKSCKLFFANRAGLSNHLRTHRKPKRNVPESPPVVSEASSPRSPSPDNSDFHYSQHSQSPPGSDPEEPRSQSGHGKEHIKYHPLLNGKIFELKMC